MSKAKKATNPKPDVIGVMCAYQEAKYIEDALASMTALGCTRLVVAEGRWQGFRAYGKSDRSTDGTQEIALKCGAEVISCPPGGWETEIAARNAYLVGKPGDWYFIMDADEVVEGSLPDLQAPEGAYIGRHTEPDGQGAQRIRLIRESGDLIYQYTHWAIYRNGRLVEEAPLTDAFHIRHIGRPDDASRNQRRNDWLAVSESREKAYTRSGRAPELYVETPDRIGYKYVGKGAFIRGVPAKDIFEYDVAKYEADIEANARTGRRLYERVLPPTAGAPSTINEADLPQEV